MGLVALLAGCRLDVDVATTIAADGSGVVSVTVRADRELVQAAPGVVNDLRLDDLSAAGWSVAGPVTAPDGTTSLVVSKPFATPDQATAVLAEVGVPLQVAVTQAREFALVQTAVDGVVSGVDLGAFSDAELGQALGGVPLADRVTPEQLAAGFAMTVRFTLPGLVTTTNGIVDGGTVDGGTVTWQPAVTPGTVTPLQALAERRDDDALAARDRETWARRGFWLWLGLVALALVGGGAVWWFRRRARAH